MAGNKFLPPPPVSSDPKDPAYRDWFYKLQQFLANAGNILFTSLNFTGSNLTSIATRNHDDLQTLDTATHTHLTATQATDLTDGGNTVLHTHSFPLFVGEQGEDGEMGPPGRDGARGVSGAAGPAGATIYIQGFDGEIGEDGSQGFPGPPGSTGIPGITGGQGPTGPAIFLEAMDGEDALWGPPGNQGVQGATGNQGTTGVQGPAGPQGIIGIGIDGNDGSDGLSVQGPRGIQGIQGSIGNTGLQGQPGPIGITMDGEDGSDGMTLPGTPGPAGTQGTTGAPGPMGPAVYLEADQGGEETLFVPSVNPFQITPMITVLGADVMMPLTSVFYNGPIVSQGSVGTWFTCGTVTVYDTSSLASAWLVKLWDGTTVISSSFATTTPGGSNGLALTLSGYITNPAGSLRISVANNTTITGRIAANASGGGKDSSLTAIRIG